MDIVPRPNKRSLGWLCKREALALIIIGRDFVFVGQLFMAVLWLQRRNVGWTALAVPRLNDVPVTYNIERQQKNRKTNKQRERERM